MWDTSRGAVYVGSLHHFSFWSQGWGSNFVWMKVDSSLSGATNDLHAGLDRDEERSHNLIILTGNYLSIIGLSVYCSITVLHVTCLCISLSHSKSTFLWGVASWLQIPSHELKSFKYSILYVSQPCLGNHLEHPINCKRHIKKSLRTC